MSIIFDEIQDVKNHCESQIPGSKIIACVPSMIRVDIRRTKHKQLTACLQFPESYPDYPLLVELKSKTLSEKFLSGLAKICEEECKKILGKPQVLKVLKFLKIFLDENPLSVCSEEVSLIKRQLDDCDQIKLKQKTSTVLLHIVKDSYFLKTKFLIPEHYPEEQVQDPPFQPKPSLWPSVKFLIEEIKRYPAELCQLCKEKCFPADPTECIDEETNEKHIERVYCGHIFHNKCLDTYIKTPPFHGGKKCPSCKVRIYHEKWKITPRLAEDRWAHQEAKKRELGEVVEFFE